MHWLGDGITERENGCADFTEPASELPGKSDIPRKPCAVEHGLSEPATHGTLAKAQVGSKAV
jgi:hypothetical protein